MTSHPTTCRCIGCAPWPGDIDPVQLHSRAYRDDRSRRLAQWLRLPEDAVESFVARMEVAWTRQRTAEASEAERHAETAEAARRRAETRGDLVTLRGGRRTRIIPPSQPTRPRRRRAA